MISETLADGLQRYRIGSKIRVLRLSKQLALTQLGAHTGLSAAMLSKIERGLLFPTLPTLLRIALVFGVGLDHFFTEQEKRPVAALVRRRDRLRLPDQAGTDPPTYLFESLDFPVTGRPMSAYYAEFPLSGKSSEPHRHAGTELIYVVDGHLVINIDGEDIGLERGDALTFDSDSLHAYRQVGKATCKAIVVTTPQSVRR
jgi:transcriptional regulator with XRE-family HTH domain